MKIIMIRHGKTFGNTEKRYVGSTDESLILEGSQELKKNVSEKKYIAVEMIFSSPMNRCIETAKIIYPDKKINIVNEFSEMNFGDFEYKNYSELKEALYYQKWIDSNGILPFPNGECREDFIKRNLLGLKKVIEKSNGKNLAIVCHGGTIMATLFGLGLGNYFDFQVENGGGYILDLEISKTISEQKILNFRRI